MNRSLVVPLFLLGCGCSEEANVPSRRPEPVVVATFVPATPPAPRRNWAECLTAEENEAIGSIPPPIVGPFGMGKRHSGGCVASLEWSGVPSASGASTFVVRAVDLPSNVPTYLVYGTEPRLDPFEGGYACVGGIVRELPSRNSSGAGPCGGSVEFDLTPLLRSGGDLALAVDAKVFCQVRFRDESDPAGFCTGSTHALQIVVQP